MPIVGFDAQATQGPRSGLGVVTSNLLCALQEEIRTPLKLRVYAQELPEHGSFNTLQRLQWENVTLPGSVRRDKIDLLHVPAFASAFLKPCRLILTVHDIAGMRFRNQLGWASTFYWGKWLPHVCKHADQIIAVSSYTKKDLVEHLRIPEQRIRVIHPSGHETFSADFLQDKIEIVKRGLGIRNRYFLFVGTLEPRKNLDRILEAFKIFSGSNSDEFQLVLVGSKDFAHGQYTKILAEKHALGTDTIIAAGFLDHESLNALYCGAQALLFPSLYEGFGIPILEAMAAGCPVLTSNITSTPEVAGNAAVLVDPYCVEAITQGMNDLASQESLRQDLKQKGFKRIRNFSWKKAARETLDVYKTMLNC